MREISKEEQSKVLSEHAEWLRGSGGSRADLKNTNLRNTNLRNTNLKIANLRNTNLRNTNLKSADLQYANLENANLKSADLYSADLQYANLRDAYLESSNLENANLRNAKNGEEMLEKCNTVLGLKWNILMFQDDVTVGCKKYRLHEWKNFSDHEIYNMHKDALDFYPLLMKILEHEYKHTKWEFGK